MGEESNVVELDVVTSLDIPVERVLEQAAKAKLTEVTVVGYTEDGDFYFASSQADGGDVLWALEQAKLDLFRVANELEEDGG